MIDAVLRVQISAQSLQRQPVFLRRRIREPFMSLDVLDNQPA